MPTSLTLEFIQTHPREAARVVSQMPLKQVVDFLREVPADAICRLVPHLPPSTSTLCLQSLDRAVAAQVIEELDITTAALLLRRLEPKRRGAMLSAMQTLKATPLQLVLDYPPGTVGSLMDPRAMTLLPDSSVEEALRQVRMSNHKSQHYLFVLGDEHNVLGYVSLHDLLFASKQSRVGNLMNSNTALIPARSKVESIRHHDQWRRMDVLPVVNQRRAYLGVVRFASVHMEEEDRNDANPTSFEMLWGLTEVCWSLIDSFLPAPKQTGSDQRKDSG